MKINTLVTETVSLCRRQPLILVPMVVPALVYLLLSLISPSTVNMASGGFAGVGAAFGRMVFISLVNVLVTLVAQGMSIVMAQEALDSGTTSLVSGWNQTLARLVPLAITSLVASVVLGFGFALLFLPGLVAALFLLFVIPEVLIGRKNPVEAISGSVRLAAANFSAVAILFLLLLALGFVLLIVSFILNLIPFVGWLLTMVAGAAFSGFAGVFILFVYRELSGGAAPRDVETD